ncbi:MAG: ROK family protein [bacterium]|nr:ROK family protein [bacterium]
MNTLAIDLGGSRVKMTVIAGDVMHPPAVFPVNSKAPLADTLHTVAMQGAALVHHANIVPDAVALALPGIVHRGRAVACNGKYEDAVTFHWNSWAHAAFGTGIRLINDAAAALYGEMHHGVARDAEAAAMLIIGTGIGTAAAQDGRVLEGRHGTMGMLGGHIAIEMHPRRRCTCGSIGCLEAWAGTWALDELAREMEGFRQSLLAQCERVDYRALAEGKSLDDPVSVALFDVVSDALGMGAVNLIHAYDPEVLILSGGPCHIPELCERIRQYVHQHAWTPWGQVEIRVAKDPEASVLWGLHHYAKLHREQKESSSPYAG